MECNKITNGIGGYSCVLVSCKLRGFTDMDWASRKAAERMMDEAGAEG
jgi:hypothetical protein